MIIVSLQWYATSKKVWYLLEWFCVLKKLCQYPGALAQNGSAAFATKKAYGYVKVKFEMVNNRV